LKKTSYLLTIKTGRKDVPPEPAANFIGGDYNLATATAGFLDGSSIGPISQENMILFGGEFSLMNNVSVEILSPEIIKHTESHGINLFGAKCSLKALSKNTEIEVFIDMCVICYSKASSISFKLTLSDSALANAFVPSAVIPEQYGGGELPIRIGGNEFVKAKKVKKNDFVYSQGTSQYFYEWGRTFPILTVEKSSSGLIAVEVYCCGLVAGDTLEVVAGKGQGNRYEILAVEGRDTLWKAILKAPYKDGILQGGKQISNNNSKTPHIQGVTAIPTLFTLYGIDKDKATQDTDDRVVIFLNPDDKYDKLTLGELSICRVINSSSLYAIAIGNKLPPVTGVVEDFRDVKIISMLDAKEWTLQSQCRYRVSDNLSGTSIHDPLSVVKSQIIHVKQWGPVSKDYQKVFSISLKKGAAPQQWFRVGMQICVQWDLGRELSCEYLIPAFGLRVETTGFRIAARALLLNDNGRALASRDFFAAEPPGRSFVYSDISASAYARISMTGDNAGDGDRGIRRENIAKQLKSALKFDSIPIGARSIYLQIAVMPMDSYYEENYTIYFRDEGIIVGESESETEHRDLSVGSLGANPIDATLQLCSFCKINHNSNSFVTASREMSLKTGVSQQNNRSYYELSKNDSLAEKLAEACRAANFSLISDGSRLEAKFFDSESETLLTFTNHDVIKGSFEIEYAYQASCITDWDFEIYIDEIRKFLYINPQNEIFPEASIWERSSTALRLSCRLTPITYYPREEYNFKGGMEVRIEIPSTADDSARYALRSVSQELTYVLVYHTYTYICRAHSLFKESETVILAVLEQIIAENSVNLWDISQKELEQGDLGQLYLAAHDYAWKNTVINNMDTSWSMARALWRSARNALESSGRNCAPDERQQKMKFAASDSKSNWLQFMLWKVKHCEYQKVLINFSIPLEAVKLGSLWQMLLHKTELKFGVFQNNPLKGWIAGVELSTMDDAVRIKFISSEPLKDKKYYNENEPLAEKKISETNTVQNAIKE